MFRRHVAEHCRKPRIPAQGLRVVAQFDREPIKSTIPIPFQGFYAIPLPIAGLCPSSAPRERSRSAGNRRKAWRPNHLRRTERCGCRPGGSGEYDTSASPKALGRGRCRTRPRTGLLMFPVSLGDGRGNGEEANLIYGEYSQIQALCSSPSRLGGPTPASLRCQVKA